MNLVKAPIKVAAKAVLGGRTYAKFTSIKSRNLQKRLLAERGSLTLSRRLVERLGTHVMTGPFKGLQYPMAALVSRHAGPKLLGTYERELHPVIESRNWREYSYVVDIGCAEGYYAVGIAKTFHQKVLGFDPEPREKELCRQMAALNEVSSMVVLGDWADARTLEELCAERRCFVLSDCEGYEAELFDRRSVQALRVSDVLIEIHEQQKGDLSSPLRELFQPTHETKIITFRRREIGDFPEFKSLGEDAQLALDEHRTDDQPWLWCQSRQSAFRPK